MANRGGKLARVIEEEMSRIEWQRLSGMTFHEACKYLKGHGSPQSKILPSLVGSQPIGGN